MSLKELKRKYPEFASLGERDFEIGYTINLDGVKILHRIGHGGMGNVYLGILGDNKEVEKIIKKVKESCEIEDSLYIAEKHLKRIEGDKLFTQSYKNKLKNFISNLNSELKINPRVFNQSSLEKICKDLNLTPENFFVVAVKFYLKKRDMNENEKMEIETFKNEIRVLSELRDVDSPYIIRLIGKGENDKAIWGIMEYIDGVNLREVIKFMNKYNENINEREKIGAIVGYSIALGLNAIHRKKIVHRDIKPANILLGYDGKVKIVDFGIAESAIPLEKKKYSLYGTPGYTAPDLLRAQFKDDDYVPDHRDDIRNLGIIIYEIITGIHPFSHITREEYLFNAITKNAWIRHEALEKSKLKEIIYYCLNSDRDSRPSNAIELAKELRKYLDQRGIAIEEKELYLSEFMQKYLPDDRIQEIEAIDAKKEQTLMQTIASESENEGKDLLDEIF